MYLETQQVWNCTTVNNTISLSLPYSGMRSSSRWRLTISSQPREDHSSTAPWNSYPHNWYTIPKTLSFLCHINFECVHVSCKRFTLPSSMFHVCTRIQFFYGLYRVKNYVHDVFVLYRCCHFFYTISQFITYMYIHCVLLTNFDNDREWKLPQLILGG